MSENRSQTRKQTTASPSERVEWILNNRDEGPSRNCVCWLPVLCLMRELLLARGEFGRTNWGRTMGRHITGSISSHAYGGHASGRRGLLSSNRSGAVAWVGRLSPRASPSLPAGSAFSRSSHCSALNCSALNCSAKFSSRKKERAYKAQHRQAANAHPRRAGNLHQIHATQHLWRNTESMPLRLQR
jgi:hypothetical protein